MCNGVKLATRKHCNQYFINQKWVTMHLASVQTLLRIPCALMCEYYEDTVGNCFCSFALG